MADGIYHVFDRGSERRRIFGDGGDRDTFLRILRRVRKKCGCSYLSYCLMPNHYHLIVRTPLPNLSEAMRHVNSSYAQAFNRRYDRCGPLFQGRYRATLIQADEHFLTVLRYVALNPVEAGLSADASGWPHSGHHELVGHAREDIVDVDAALSLIDARRERALRAYHDLVGVTEVDPPSARGGVVVGDQRFAAAAVAAAVASPEIPAKQRLAGRPGLGDVLSAGRAAGIQEAYFTHGYTQREIAEQLGCHYSTVSRRLRAAVCD